MLPLLTGQTPTVTLLVDAVAQTTLAMELWVASRPGNGTPDQKLATALATIQAGKHVTAEFRFDLTLHRDCHAFLIVPATQGVELHMSQQMLPGVLTLWQKANHMVAKSAVQTPPAGSGIDTFPFWLPVRRPAARNLALSFVPPIRCYQPELTINGWHRPWCGTNAWAPSDHDPAPTLTITWKSPQRVRTIELTFDTDFDHPMESVQMGHPERVMPGCVRAFQICTAEGGTLATVTENHQTRWQLTLPEEIETTGLALRILERGPAPPAVFEVRCY
jgi:hypothetical protein